MKNKPKPKLNQSASRANPNLTQINENAAGIDIGSGEHWGCVPSDQVEVNVRKFGGFTLDSVAMADWLNNYNAD